MKHFIVTLLRVCVVASLLLGGVQPAAVIHAQPPAAEALASSVAVENAPPQPYANVWPGQIKPGYQYSRSFGESGIPYPPENQEQYLNTPAGLVLDGNGDLFAIERDGNRLFGLHTSSTPGTLLDWAPYGVAGVQGNPGNPDTVMNNAQQLWSDDAAGYLWVTNWNYISIFDKSSGVPLWNIQNFDSNGLFWESSFDCLRGVAVDTTTTPWQLFVSETCNKNLVLVFEIQDPYTDTPTLTLKNVLRNDQMGFGNSEDLQLVDRSEGGNIDKRLFWAHDNGLTEFSTTTEDPADWAMLDYLNIGGSNVRGLALNPNDADHIYAASNTKNGPMILEVDIDPLNWRDFIPGWDNFTNSQNFEDLQDLVFDPDGNMYLSDISKMVIRKFTTFTSPFEQSVFYGAPGVPYTTPLVPTGGHYYYYAPSGVALDANDNIYILENRGQRLTKLSADGAYQWSFGSPGISVYRESTTGVSWPQGNPAVDQNGTVYIPDWNNNRVILLDQNGAYMGTIGNQPEEFYRFDCPGGVAIGPNGDIYVTDWCSNNVQVYDSNRYYRSTIGIKREWGEDNAHFNDPTSVAVRDANTVLVTDRNNNRVQECKRIQHGVNPQPDGTPYYQEEWSCQTVAGITGESTNNHPAYLSNPAAVAWDAVHQWMLVGDQTGVMIYDQNYQLIGTLGNRQVNGTQPGMFWNLSALAVDSSGNLYAADWNNMRVDRFIPSLNPLELAGVNGGPLWELGKVDVLGQSYLAMNMGARVAALSLADPSAPSFAGVSDLLPEQLKSFTTQGAYAYELGSDDYLRIFSFTNPAKPTLVSEMAMIGAQGLAVENGWVFAGSCCAGGNAWQGPRLLAIDASDPAAPSVAKIQILDMQNQPRWSATQIAAHFDGDHSIDIYIALQQPGLEKYTFDLTSQTFSGPSHYSEKDLGGNPMVFERIALSEDGSRLYALDFQDWDPGQARLHTLDTATFTDDPVFSPVDTGLGEARMYLSGTRLYLPGWNYMEVYDTGNMLAAPKIVRTNGPDMVFNVLLESGGVLYSVEGGELMSFSLDLDQPDEFQRATLLSRFVAPGGYPGFLSADAGVVFAAQWGMGVSRFTTQDPGKPIETHQVLDQNTNRVKLGKVDGHLYAFILSGYDKGSDQLAVLDGDDPNDRLADSVSAYPVAPGDPPDGKSVFNSGGTNLVVLPGDLHHALVYIAGVYGGMRVYDVDFSDPDNVAIAYVSDTNLNLDSFGNTNTIAVISHYLLIPNQNTGVKVVDLDLSDPANPQEVAQIDGHPVAVGALDGKAYVFTTDNAFRVYEPVDQDDPGAGFTESLPYYWNGPFNWPTQINLKAFGAVTQAYLTTGNQVIVMDVTDPDAMRILAYDNKQNAWINSGVNIGNFFLASEGNLGLYSYWAPPQTEGTLSLTTDVLDSSAVDGVQYHLNAAPASPITLLHMPVYTGNVSATFPDGLQGTGHTFELAAREAATDRAMPSLGDGTYTVSVEYTDDDIPGLSENSLALYYWDGAAWHKEYSSVVDAAHNTVSATPNHFSLWTLAGRTDATAPVGALLINEGDDYTKLRDVTLTLSGLSPDADRVRFKEDCGACTWTNWVSSAGSSFPLTLSAGDGLKTVTAELVDTANNSAQIQATITLDTTPPGGSFTITETNPTNLNPVHLNLSGITDALSGMDQMKLSEDPAFAGAAWQAYIATPAFSLSGGDGAKTIYARFSDQIGNTSTAEIKASIVLDATAPSGTLVIIGTGEPTVTREVSLVLTGTDNLTGISRMRLSEDSGFSGASWGSYAAITTFTLSAGDGLKTVYAQLQDVAGNTSSVEIKDTIPLDTTAPTGSISIAQKPYTTNATVDLTLAGAGAATMRLANTTVGLNAATWEPFAASKTGWALNASGTDGLKTVYIQYKDGSGNLSPVYADTTILDTTAPAGTLYINGGMALSATPDVSLFLTVAETGSGVAQYQVATNSSMTGATWTSFANPIHFTLPAGDGVKTVYIQLKDNAGNVSLLTSDTIILDSTAPTGTIFINADARVYYTHQVILALSAVDGFSPAADLQMQVSNDAAFSGAAWQAYQTSLVWSVIPGSGDRTVYVRYRDSAGNISTYQALVTVRVYLYLAKIIR